MTSLFSWLKRTGTAVLVFAQVFSWSVIPVHAQTSISFSGRTWIVKSGFDGPGPNYWNGSPSAVFVDTQGRLHLKITQVNGVWYSSEVYLPGSLGYGTYHFDVDSSVGTIDSNVVAAPFLYQDDAHEIDMEFSNWQTPGDRMGQYVVQPFTKTGNMTRFSIPTSIASSTHSIQWTPTQIGFSSYQNNTLLKQWTYTGSNNFVPGKEVVHINHWLIDGVSPSNGQEQELIIKSFSFTPSTTTTIKKRPRR